MPIFDYQCKDCNATYDVFHKVREVLEDVICPSCGSTNHQRLLSAPNIAGVSPARQSSGAGRDAGFGGCCGGGACGLN